MWRWYKGPLWCIVYLHDVSDLDSNDSGLEQSEWFTRGWTLQELLAPLNMEFYSKDYMLLGDKDSLSERISQITGIGTTHLLNIHLTKSLASVAER